MNSSQKQTPHFLGTTRAERLLTEWANIPDPQSVHADAAIARLIGRYPQVFPEPAQDRPHHHWETVLYVRGYLRKAWDAPDSRHRDWYIFKVRDTYRFSTERGVWEPRRDAAGQPLDPSDQDLEQWNAPPPLTCFEQAMYHFHRISDRARHCANPECPAPYFFATKKGQKYCSVTCSAPAQREQKRRWWRQNRGKTAARAK